MASLPIYDEDLGKLRDSMIHHPVFRAVSDIRSLRLFMEVHVFAVWDFMSLVKRLQRELTCLTLPWLPPTNRHAAQLINQIVLGEETDIGPDGAPTSHLELYIAAMREVGADTTGFEQFSTALASGLPLAKAFDEAAVPDFVRNFTSHTLLIAREAPLIAAMASFFYGREDAIPQMFASLLADWGIDAATAPTFVYYLERHIEIDSDQHGPAAAAILTNLVAGDPQCQCAVLIAARRSIEARIRLWDGLLALLLLAEPHKAA
jgi:hypothetical protein